MNSNDRLETIIIDLISPSIQVLHECMSSSDGRKVEIGLKKILDSAASVLVSFIPQLLILDGNNKILYPVLVNPGFEDSDPEVNVGLLRYAASSLGYKIDGNGSGSEIYGDLIKRANIETSDIGVGVYCKRKRLFDGDENGLGGIYEVYKLDATATSSDEILGDLITDESELNIASGYWADIMRNGFAQDDFKEMVLVAFCWPESGDLPKTSGIVGFLLKDNCDLSLIKNQLNSIHDTREKLFAMRKQIVLLCWLIQSTTLIMQSYALSQASTRSPERIIEGSLIRLWTDLLRIHFDSLNCDSGQHPNLYQKNLILQWLSLQVSCHTVKRSILKNIFDGHYRNDNQAMYFSHIFYEILSLFKHRDFKEYSSIYEIVKSLDNNKKNEFLTSINIYFNNEIFSSLFSNFGLLCLYLPKEYRNNFLVDKVIPTIKLILSQTLNNEEDAVECDQLMPCLCFFFEEISEFSSLSLINECKSLILRVLNEKLDLSAKIVDRCFSSLLILSKHQGAEYSPDNWSFNNKNIEKLQYIVGNFFGASEIAFRSLDSIHRENILDNSPNTFKNNHLYDVFREINRELNASTQNRIPKSTFLSNKVNLVTIYSGKGGVGKTTTAVAYAAYLALKNINTKVCLIDLDILGPGLEIFISKDQRPDVYLNHYLWASYIRDCNRNNDVNGIAGVQKALRKHSFLFHKFKDLAESSSLTEDLLQDSLLADNLKIIPASSSLKIQKATDPIIDSTRSRVVLYTQLNSLIKELAEIGYSYVIIDSPAEVRDLTVCALDLSAQYNGQNIYIANLNPTSLAPIFRAKMMADSLDCKSSIIVNRVRNIEQKMCNNKQSFIEYCTRVQDDIFGTNYFLSPLFIETFLNITSVGCIPWLESLERLFSHSSIIGNEVGRELAGQIQKHCFEVV